LNMTSLKRGVSREANPPLEILRSWDTAASVNPPVRSIHPRRKKFGGQIENGTRVTKIYDGKKNEGKIRGGLYTSK